MVSRVLQVGGDDLAVLDKVGVRYKDVTARERHLKLTINRLKCELAGDSARYFVVERRKLAQLSRVATAAEALPIAELAKREPEHAPALRALQREVQKLARMRPRRGVGVEGGKPERQARERRPSAPERGR